MTADRQMPSARPEALRPWAAPWFLRGAALRTLLFAGLTVSLFVGVTFLWLVNTPGWRGARDAGRVRDSFLRLRSADEIPRIDAETGLAVAWFTAGREIQAPYIEAWNRTVLARFRAGHALPTYRDRISDVETMHRRFEEQRAAAIPIAERREKTKIGDCWIFAAGDQVLASRTNFMPTSGTGIPSLSIGDGVRALVLDGGKTVWLQGHRDDGTETYAVIDAERAWVIQFLERAPQ